MIQPEILDLYNREVPTTAYDELKEKVEQKFPGSRVTIIVSNDQEERGAIYNAGDLNEPIYLASTVKPVFAAAALHLAEEAGISMDDPIPLTPEKRSSLALERNLEESKLKGLTLRQTIKYLLGPSSNAAVTLIKDWMNDRFGQGDNTFASNEIQKFGENLLHAELKGIPTFFTIRGSNKENETLSPNCANALEMFTLGRLIMNGSNKLDLSKEAIGLTHDSMRSGHGDEDLEMSKFLKDIPNVRVTDKSGTYPDLEANESPQIAGVYDLDIADSSRCMQLSSVARLDYNDSKKRILFYHIGVPYTVVAETEELKDDALGKARDEQIITLKQQISVAFVQELAKLMI